MDEQELLKIIGELRGMEVRFETFSGAHGPSLNGADRAAFQRMLLEAKEILGSSIGRLNVFSLPIDRVLSARTFGMLSRPSPEDLQEATGLIEGGLNQLRRKNSQVHPRPGASRRSPYAGPSRILQLRNFKSAKWDLTRLVRLLEELNLADEQGAHISTAILVRAIADHVPPIFNHGTFRELANNYSAGGRSFSEQLKHLDISLRKVADAQLHQQIRKAESLPLEQQVDFRAALDTLLAEVLRILE